MTPRKPRRSAAAVPADGVSHGLDPDELLEAFRRMALIRAFEQRAATLYRDDEIPGFLHLSLGQEAAAVGACWPLRRTDVITSTHRGHGHCLAKGLEVGPMFAELMGKETGTCGGRGGSMHIADPRQGVFGANGIVGAGLPIATGAAAAAGMRESGDVVVAFFGDGAVAQGMFHEAVNLAAVWDLPVAFVCENNGFAEFSRAEDQGRAGLEARAGGYGVAFRQLDGNDVDAMATGMQELVDAMRERPAPVLVEALTHRWRGHYEGDSERYRDREELVRWRERDPLLVARRRLEQLGIETARIDGVQKAAEAEVERAVADGRAAAYPPAEEMSWHVGAPRSDVLEPPAPVGEPFRVMDAVRDALRHELATDSSVFLAGIDVAGGNVFGLTRGLADEFPGRVRDTPISETAIAGLAVGAAMAGMRPVVEIMYMDFVGACFDQLLNQAAKLRYMTGGLAGLPLVVRTQFGGGKGSGSQHSQSLEALLAHVPGLTVVMPSTPADTYGLLRAAIQDPNPVLVVDHRLLYGRKGPRPEADHLVPIGKARVVRDGADVTIVSYSRMVHECLAAAVELAQEGIDAEVIDLRTIVPLDRESVLASVAKTGRLVVAHEAVRDFGVGAELAALAADEGFWDLDAPVVRVGAAAAPAPFAPSLERAWLPDRVAVAAAVRRVVGQATPV